MEVSKPMTVEESVLWLRQQPQYSDLVRQCYFDDPLLDAAERFALSDEWKAVRRILRGRCGRAVDLGAGRGMASYALARDGWDVVAAEPNTSSLVGTGALRELLRDSNLRVRIVHDYAENLSIADDSVDLVYCRQVLHHVRDLSLLCREANRILKPGGLFLAAREPVISSSCDMEAFLNSCVLHRLHGEEKAYLLDEYISVIKSSGLILARVLGCMESVINYYPMSHEDWRARCSSPLFGITGYSAAMFLTSEGHWMGRRLLRFLARRASMSSNTPGRMYSFVAKKSASGEGCHMPMPCEMLLPAGGAHGAASCARWEHAKSARVLGIL